MHFSTNSFACSTGLLKSSYCSGQHSCQQIPSLSHTSDFSNTGDWCGLFSVHTALVRCDLMHDRACRGYSGSGFMWSALVAGQGKQCEGHRLEADGQDGHVWCGMPFCSVPCLPQTCRCCHSEKTCMAFLSFHLLSVIQSIKQSLESLSVIQSIKQSLESLS